MPTTKNYSDLRMLGLRYRSATGAEILSIRVFNGTILLGVNLDKQLKPIFNRHWKLNELYVIANIMQEFTKAEPNTDKTLVFNSYNRVEKKKTLDYVMILRKDERKIYHIIIKSAGQTYDFPIRGVQDITYGTGDIPEEDRSKYEWLFIINMFFKLLVPQQVQMTNWPIDPAQQPGNRQGGQGGYQQRGQNGGYQGGGGYSPRPNSNGEFQSSRGLPGDEDIFE